MSVIYPRFLEPSRSIPFMFGAGASIITMLALVALAKTTLNPSPGIISSPRATRLPKLPKQEQEALPYAPDAFPGARDVDSPYGIMRVYEWGPENGRKVLLMHGISTPCASLGGVATALVEKGCRVILLDLWGRGYSDSPNLPHDSRLYSTQILLAITSSPISWTPEGFNLIGYSLGGGIVADFASHFPDLVKSVVLLAPAGLIRPHHFGWSSRLMYTGLIPEVVLERAIRKRLGGTPKPAAKQSGTEEKPTTRDEVKGNRDPEFESAILVQKRSGVTIAETVQWQVENHEGFIRSFISSVKFSSIEGKQANWKKLGLRADKTLIIAGSTDPVIIAKELQEDAEAAIGVDKVDFRIIDGAHEFPITQWEEVVRVVSTFWSL